MEELKTTDSVVSSLFICHKVIAFENERHMKELKITHSVVLNFFMNRNVKCKLIIPLNQC